MYRHKKTGKLYQLIQGRILFKDVDMEPALVDGEYYEQEKYYWRGKETDSPIQEQFVLYKAAYNNPDGPYFVRHKKDWDNEFEECINGNHYPLEKTILDEKKLYDVPGKVLRYTWKEHPSRYDYETVGFLRVNKYLLGQFYSDEGEYEAYLTDGEKYLGTNLHNLWNSKGYDALKKFVDEQTWFDKDKLKIMYIDYPEDK